MQIPTNITWSSFGFLAKKSVGALRQAKFCTAH